MFNSNKNSNSNTFLKSTVIIRFGVDGASHSCLSFSGRRVGCSDGERQSAEPRNEEDLIESDDVAGDIHRLSLGVPRRVYLRRLF